MMAPDQQSGGENGQSDLSRAINKDSLWCTYYKKSRHTKEKCLKLHGRPHNSKIIETGSKGVDHQRTGSCISSST